MLAKSVSSPEKYPFIVFHDSLTRDGAAVGWVAAMKSRTSSRFGVGDDDLDTLAMYSAVRVSCFAGRSPKNRDQDLGLEGNIPIL